MERANKLMVNVLKRREKKQLEKTKAKEKTIK
jgi:hypothetical protein